MKTKVDNKNPIAGMDITIPGSDKFDTLENLGIEEEEYEFYSFGVDDHNNMGKNARKQQANNYNWFIMTLKDYNHKST